jgi:tRNA-dihydrouridine synthase
MRYDFAPLEGLTDSIYRRLHHKYFPGVDRYFTPVFSPTVHRALTPREARELPPADSMDFSAVPQLLTKNAQDFLWMAQQCKDLGYGEVNLNLGCPSGTVTAKGKGSGMLRDPDGLDAFLYEIFASAPLPVSVKTRIGFASPEEFPRLLDIFNRYPISLLVIHPRVRTQFYKGEVDMEAFRYAAENSRAPLCYNGDLTSLSRIEDIQLEYPALQSVMLGRGLISDPGMLTPDGTTAPALERFMDALLEEYAGVFGSSRNAMFRLKENWGMLESRFDGGEKLFKQLRKTTDYSQFLSLSHQILHTVPLK